MKKTLLSAFLTFCVFSSGFSQEKIYETKITANPFIGFGAGHEKAVYAGGKNLNVVNLSSGKIVLDKYWRDAGITISKVADAYVSNDLSKVVLCDKNTVSCVDANSGSKLWETKSFTELDNGASALLICDGYVLVSDKKAKDNYTLTCLNIDDGSQLWTLSNEKSKIRINDLYFIPSGGVVGIFSPRKEKTNLFRLINLESGKVNASIDMEGTPIYSYLDEGRGMLYVHHMVTEENSYVSAFSMLENQFMWKTKCANKSPQTPMTMNTDVIKYYAKIRRTDDKVLLITEGIEAFDAFSGKSLYNIPFVPYYKWGVGHYTNGIFEPEVTPYGILIADRTKGDLYIKMMDINTGAQLWSSDKLKDMDCAPTAVVSEDNAAIQFGGLNYFEVMNNTGIGKLLKPFTVMSFDLKSGKLAWTVESKKDFYYISPANEDIMIVGTKDFQTVDAKTGSILKTEKNPFKEDYFMTKYDLSSTHRLQKNVTFDFSARRFLLLEEGKLSLSSF